MSDHWGFVLSPPTVTRRSETLLNGCPVQSSPSFPQPPALCWGLLLPPSTPQHLTHSLSLCLLFPSLSLSPLIFSYFQSFSGFSHHLSFPSNFSMSIFWFFPLSFLSKILNILYLFAKFSFTYSYRTAQADASVSLASLTRNLSCTFSCLFLSTIWLTE